MSIKVNFSPLQRAKNKKQTNKKKQKKSSNQHRKGSKKNTGILSTFSILHFSQTQFALNPVPILFD